MTELFPYQQVGADWLTTKKVALLADEMGVGKSAQAIRAADAIGAKDILVICPAVARTNWLREFAKFSTTPRRVAVLNSGSDSQASSEVVVTSYDLAAKVDKRHFDVLILDEAHYLKSVDAKRAKRVMGKAGLVHQAHRVWLLSGTPMPNNPSELWVMLYSFGQTKLKYPDFIEKFCRFVPGRGPGSGMLQISGAKQEAIPELKALLAPIMLRRKKEDVLKDLPPIMFTDVVVDPGPVDIEKESSFLHYVIPRDRRAELRDKLLGEQALVQQVLDHAGTGANGMKALEALASSVSTLRRYNGLQKVKSVLEMLHFELENDLYKKIVVFAIHRDVIEAFRSGLAKYRAVSLYGKTEPLTRQRNVDEFQNNPKCRVFVGNILAAGTSITLTAADQVLFVEQDWVPGNNAQAAMRCHRIGQTRAVTVRFAGLANSLDEKIAAVLKIKTRDIIEIFDNAP